MNTEIARELKNQTCPFFHPDRYIHLGTPFRAASLPRVKITFDLESEMPELLNVKFDAILADSGWRRCFVDRFGQPFRILDLCYTNLPDHVNALKAILVAYYVGQIRDDLVEAWVFTERADSPREIIQKNACSRKEISTFFEGTLGYSCSWKSVDVGTKTEWFSLIPLKAFEAVL